MIYYRIESATAHPDLARGTPPPGLLTAVERRTFDGLRSDKRRRDWLLGRWTAKRLLRAYAGMAGHADGDCPLDALSIANEPCGAPVAAGPHLPPVMLSISHSGGLAVCALAPVPPGMGGEWTESAGLGVDLERVEPRPESFVQDFLTPEEQVLVRQAPQAMHALLITAMWTAKEAALKALHLGLTVDTRAVAACPERPGDAGTWAAIDLRLDAERLAGVRSMTGWTQVFGCYILTLAAAKELCASPNDIRAVDARLV